MKKALEQVKKVFSKENRKKTVIILGTVVVVTAVTVTLAMRKTISIIVDGEESIVTTYKGTVQGALHENNIVLAPKDKVEPELESKISRNDTINIRKAVNLTVTVDGQDIQVVSAEDNIATMLELEGVQLNEDDKVLPSKEAELYEDMEVEVIRVETKEVNDIVPIAFETSVTNDDTLIDTYMRVTKEGQIGEKEVKSKVVYENGEEVSRTVLEEVVLKEPVNKEVIQGTLKTLSVNRGGNSLNYTKKINCKATAYSPINGATTAYTYSGMKATRNPNGYSTIAVDPRVIPLGTKVYVDGYGYAIAADTGSSVKGNFIDVFFNTYNEACNWGLKYVDVYILE